MTLSAFMLLYGHRATRRPDVDYILCTLKLTRGTGLRSHNTYAEVRNHATGDLMITADLEYVTGIAAERGYVFQLVSPVEQY